MKKHLRPSGIKQAEERRSPLGPISGGSSAAAQRCRVIAWLAVEIAPCFGPDTDPEEIAFALNGALLRLGDEVRA